MKVTSRDLVERVAGVSSTQYERNSLYSFDLYEFVVAELDEDTKYRAKRKTKRMGSR